MKKLILCLLLLFSLWGCHGSSDATSFKIPESFNEDREYEIVFWAKNDTNKVQVAIYQKAIEDFEKLYPNIHVKMRLYTDYGMIYNDVITNIQTGTTPNICITYPDHIATYLTGNEIVVPLDELMLEPNYGLGGSDLRFDSPSKDEVIDNFLNEGKINGQTYILPYMRSSEACYINKTYVEALGYEIPDVLTWDFIWEVSEKASIKDENGMYLINNQNVLIPFIYKSTDNMMIQMLYQLNAPYASEKGDILLFNDTSRELLLKLSNYVSKGLFSTFKISSYPANFLNAGQCIFAIDSTAGATWMGSKAPLIDISEDKLVDFETVVRPVPQFDMDNQKMISQGPSLCLFNKEDPDEVLASWLFMQYLLTNEIQIAYAQTEGYIPVTHKALNSDEYQNYLNSEGIDNNEHYEVKIQATKLVLDNIDNSFVTPVFNGSASLRDAAGQMVENVTKSIRRGEIVDDAYIDKLYQDIYALYHLDQSTSANTTNRNLGKMPTISIILIVTIVILWLGIIGYFVSEYLKKKRISNN